MPETKDTSTNRVLVVDDDAQLIGEYVRCLGEDFEPDIATTTLGDLEKVLFGEETDEKGAARFEVHSRNQGEAAVEAVEAAIAEGSPYSIVFIDIRLPPGQDGITSAKQIRELDPNVNIVIVTGSLSIDPDNLGKEIPPADKVFFFKKPFHGAECRQVIREDLCINHVWFYGGTEIVHRYLRSILHPAEHRFAKKDPVKGNSVETSDKLPLVPAFDAVGISEFM